jgi:hypothetical protein
LADLVRSRFSEPFGIAELAEKSCADGNTDKAIAKPALPEFGGPQTHKHYIQRNETVAEYTKLRNQTAKLSSFT